MQCAFFRGICGGLSSSRCGNLNFFRRRRCFFGRCRHHQANGCSFSLGFAPAIPQINGARRIFSSLHFGLSSSFVARFSLRVGQRGFFFLGQGFSRQLGGFRRFGLDSARVHHRVCGSRLLRFNGQCSGTVCGLTRALLLLLALQAALHQLFFLAANQLGLTARLPLATSKLCTVDDRRCKDFLQRLYNRFNRRINPFFAAHKSAHFFCSDRDGTHLTGGVCLLDFRGRLFDQRDLLALRAGRAVTHLQMRQQAVLVRISQRVSGRLLGNTCRLQLFKQRGG